jgi:hypothetical protein
MEHYGPSANLSDAETDAVAKKLFVWWSGLPDDTKRRIWATSLAGGHWRDVLHPEKA